ncbi:MAG: Asp-tRNA(Asn)/Glu-tRNA(Gln) amidotransferase subunit GatA [Patescibacteria group bacterium]
MKINIMLRDLHQKLVNKEISAKELVGQYLGKIKKTDDKIGAYLSVFEKKALAQAEEVDKKIQAGKKINFLEGIPYACKDNILIEGERSTCGSKILENYLAPYDAVVIEKLNNAGAVCLGKTNMDEFAMGSSCETSAFKKTRNPHDSERVPGGSSGGSAAAVASGQCVFSLGSDTGGSIRQPAAFCGVVGFKPTYGRVSRYGLVALASSLDQIGPLTSSVEDAAMVFAAIGGFDEKDSTSLTESMENFGPLFSPGLKDLKIGVPKEYFEQGVDKKIKEKVKAAIKKMEDLGAKVDEVSLPHTKYALACYYIILPSEACANLARYDGIRYGYSVNAPKNLLDTYLESRASGFGPEVKRRIMLGTYALSAGYYDAYYKKAQKVRTKVIEDFKKAFEKFDLLVTPTTPTVAFKLGEKIQDPLAMYMSDILTVPVNIAGLPALSLPCGFIGKLPVGLQIIGDYYNEKKLLEGAWAYEAADKN